MNRISPLEKKYALEALQNGFRTSLNGVFNKRLETAFAKKFGVRFAIGHVNGTATLHTALAAAGVGPGDEVIVPPLTMSSPAIAVLENGSIPVFADVDSQTFTLTADAIERAITRKTRAVMVVSLYGLSPDYDRITALCRRRRLVLIEDNAQCFLGRYKGRWVGTFGDFSSWSFQASKHMTCGEGGMLTTNRLEYADKARRFNSLGYAGVSAKKGKISREDIQDPKYSRHVSVGFNYRLSEIAAAVALGQLERLTPLVRLRQEIAKCFDAAVGGSTLFRRQAVPKGYEHAYWTYALVLESARPERDWYRFRDHFKSLGGDGYYAAWKLSYQEPLFLKQVQRMKGVWQNYRKPLCPNAESLQPRLIQLKTNYGSLAEARPQAEILRKAIRTFSL